MDILKLSEQRHPSAFPAMPGMRKDLVFAFLLSGDDGAAQAGPCRAPFVGALLLPL